MNFFLNETIFKPRIRRKREQNYDCILSCFFLLADKSFDLKYVIRQMLDPDPKSRPTVDQVLAFPYVRKVSHVLYLTFRSA
jgi:hypothetical protein